MANNIKTQLTRELKNHPVKAGVLALLGVVALWFWAPLVIGIFTGNADEAQTPPAAAAAVAVVPTSSNSGSNASEDNSRLSWSTLVALMDDDPLKQPLEKLNLSRDPFSSVLALNANSGGSTGNPANFPTANIPGRPLPSNGEGVSPNGAEGTADQQVGPALMGTAIGANKRAAVIDGKPTQEGEFFEANDGQRYFVESVSPRQVVLRLGSQTLVLTQGEDEAAQDNAGGNVVIRRSAG